MLARCAWGTGLVGRDPRIPAVGRGVSGNGQACTMPVHGLMLGKKPGEAVVDDDERAAVEEELAEEDCFFRFFFDGEDGVDRRGLLLVVDPPVAPVGGGEDRLPR